MSAKQRNKIRVLITGGAGFVGSNIAVAIKTYFEDAELCCLDNLYRKGSELNLPRLEKYGIKFVKGDIRNYSDLEGVGNFELIIECSAEPSVLAGKDGSTDYLVGTNLYGAINCAGYCRKYKSAMIFLSTSRVYPIDALLSCEIRKGAKRFDFAEKQILPGVSPNGISEEFPIYGARSLYGATKLAAETMLIDYAEAFDFPLVINRFGVIAGPWQFGKSDQGIAPFWLAGHLFNKELKYIGFGGNGLQVRDFLHVDDAAKLIILQISQIDKFLANRPHSGRFFNVGGGKKNSVSLIELTEICRAVSGKDIKIGSESETRYADIPVYISDYSKINKLIAWQPEKNVYNIIEDIAKWINDSPEAKKIFC